MQFSSSIPGDVIFQFCGVSTSSAPSLNPPENPAAPSSLPDEILLKNPVAPTSEDDSHTLHDLSTSVFDSLGHMAERLEGSESESAALRLALREQARENRVRLEEALMANQLDRREDEISLLVIRRHEIEAQKLHAHEQLTRNRRQSEEHLLRLELSRRDLERRELLSEFENEVSQVEKQKMDLSTLRAESEKRILDLEVRARATEMCLLQERYYCDGFDIDIAAHRSRETVRRVRAQAERCLIDASSEMRFREEVEFEQEQQRQQQQRQRHNMMSSGSIMLMTSEKKLLKSEILHRETEAGLLCQFEELARRSKKRDRERLTEIRRLKEECFLWEKRERRGALEAEMRRFELERHRVETEIGRRKTESRLVDLCEKQDREAVANDRKRMSEIRRLREKLLIAQSRLHTQKETAHLDRKSLLTHETVLLRAIGELASKIADGNEDATKRQHEFQLQLQDSKSEFSMVIGELASHLVSCHEESILRNKVELEHVLGETQAECGRLRESEESLRSQIAGLQSKTSEQGSQFASRYKKIVGELKTALSATEEMLALSSETVGKLQSESETHTRKIAALVKERAALSTQNRQLNSDLRSHSEKIAELNLEVQQRDTDVAEVKEALSNSMALSEDLDRRLEDASCRCDALSSQNESMSREIVGLKDSNAHKCSVVERQENVIVELQSQLEASGLELGVLGKRVVQISSRLDDVSSEFQNHQKQSQQSELQLRDDLCQSQKALVASLEETSKQSQLLNFVRRQNAARLLHIEERNVNLMKSVLCRASSTYLKDTAETTNHNREKLRSVERVNVHQLIRLEQASTELHKSLIAAREGKLKMEEVNRRAQALSLWREFRAEDSNVELRKSLMYALEVASNRGEVIRHEQALGSWQALHLEGRNAETQKSLISSREDGLRKDQLLGHLREMASWKVRQLEELNGGLKKELLAAKEMSQKRLTLNSRLTRELLEQKTLSNMSIEQLRNEGQDLKKRLIVSSEEGANLRCLVSHLKGKCSFLETSLSEANDNRTDLIAELTRLRASFAAIRGESEKLFSFLVAHRSRERDLDEQKMVQLGASLVSTRQTVKSLRDCVGLSQSECVSLGESLENLKKAHETDLRHCDDSLRNSEKISEDRHLKILSLESQLDDALTRCESISCNLAHQLDSLGSNHRSAVESWSSELRASESVANGLRSELVSLQTRMGEMVAQLRASLEEKEQNLSDARDVGEVLTEEIKTLYAECLSQMASDEMKIQRLACCLDDESRLKTNAQNSCERLNDRLVLTGTRLQNETARADELRASLSDTEDNLNATTTQLRDLERHTRATIRALKAQLVGDRENARVKRCELVDQIALRDRSLEEAESKIRANEVVIDEMSRRIAELDETISDRRRMNEFLQSELKEVKSDFDAHVAEATRTQSELKERGDAAQSHVEHLDSHVAYLRRKYQAATANWKRKQTGLEEHIGQLNEELAECHSCRDSLVEKITDREDECARLQKRVRELRGRTASSQEVLRREREKFSEELGAIQEQLRAEKKARHAEATVAGTVCQLRTQVSALEKRANAESRKRRKAARALRGEQLARVDLVSRLDRFRKRSERRLADVAASEQRSRVRELDLLRIVGEVYERAQMSVSDAQEKLLRDIPFPEE